MPFISGSALNSTIPDETKPDGGENKLDDDEIEDNPAYIPRKGNFFLLKLFILEAYLLFISMCSS